MDTRSPPFPRFAVCALVLLLGVVAFHQNRRTHAYGTQLREAETQAAQLRRQLADANAAAASVDSENETLLVAIDRINQTLRPATPAREEANTPAPLTEAVVQQRYENGRDLARRGRYAAALEELLWCYDEGMPRVPQFRGVRTSFLLSEIEKMAEIFSPAREALWARRSEAETRLLATGERQAAVEFAVLNRRLGDNARTVALFDQLPAGDSRRAALVTTLADQFVAQQRYQDAAELHPLPHEATVQFDRLVQLRASQAPAAPHIEQRFRASIVNRALRDIEILAGVGRVPEALALAEKMTAFDTSPATRGRLQERLTRAGQSNALAAHPIR